MFDCQNLRFKLPQNLTDGATLSDGARHPSLPRQRTYANLARNISSHPKRKQAQISKRSANNSHNLSVNFSNNVEIILFNASRKVGREYHANFVIDDVSSIYFSYVCRIFVYMQCLASRTLSLDCEFFRQLAVEISFTMINRETINYYDSFRAILLQISGGARLN